jgi:magnesium-transporting ATPase (P-type)
VTKSVVAPASSASAHSERLAEDLQIVHASYGRLRVHLPRWSGKGGRHIAAALRRLHGVKHVHPNHVTGNVLIEFAPRHVSEDQVLARLRDLRLDLRQAPEPGTYDARPAVVEETVGRRRRARIPVRGMERDPGLAPKLVQHLEGVLGVHAEVNPLTGRVTVSYDERLIHLEDLLAEVAHLQLPVLPGEDEPAHPLDPRPLVRGTTRAVGALLGLGFVTAQRLMNPAAQGQPTAAAIAGIFNLLQAFPAVRRGLARMLGTTGADVAAHSVSIVALAAADIPLGLVLAGAEAFLLLNVVTQRRAAWRRYEDGLDAAAHTSVGAIIRVEAGMRVPRVGRIVEGTGTALGRSGRVLPLQPGLRVPAGSRVAGGPFVIELLSEEPFEQQPRAAEPRLDLLRHYLRVGVPVSLAYAAGVGLVTGSLLRGFEALLLFNPHPAMVAGESATLAASARALRAGLTIVGSRPKRHIRRPDVLLIDGPRILTDGLEVSTVIPLDNDIDVPEFLELAGEVAAAAGSPWGGAFSPCGIGHSAEGGFHDMHAFAAVAGVRYILGPATTPVDVDAAVDRRHQDGRLLLLMRDSDQTKLGLIAVAPPRRPDANSPRLEITTILPLDEGVDTRALLDLAGSVARASGSPWGIGFPTCKLRGKAGHFDGVMAGATVNGIRYTLRPPTDKIDIGAAVAVRAAWGYRLVLEREDGVQLGLVALRPRLSPGTLKLVRRCERHGVRIELLPGVAPDTARSLSRRTGISLHSIDEAVHAVRAEQAKQLRVAVVSDGAHAAAAFAECDLAIGMAAGHDSYFPAQADLLAPNLTALADLIETGARRDQAARDGTIVSMVCNAIGLGLSFQGPLTLQVAFIPGYIAAMTAMGWGLFRLRGGDRPESLLGYISDPRPERWGRRAVPNVLRALHSSEIGLSRAAAMKRLRPRPAALEREQLLAALGKQLRAPTMSLIAGGACVTLLLGQPINTVLLSTTLSINVLAGLWQERQVSEGGSAVRRLAAPTARVLRDGVPVVIPASEVVPGDVLLLQHGERVAADARLIHAEALEVNEAVLTGESLPVTKDATARIDHQRIVLEGSDVIAGMARAVVVAVGRHTRLGAAAAAMNINAERESPLGIRLARVLRVALPVAITGGAVVGAAEWAYTGAPIAEMITLGITTALSTIPEGLPILAGVGSASVSRRLSQRNIMVRRFAGIEALGRVDVACTDKTGTLTEGRLSVCLIDDLHHETALPASLSERARHLLLTAGLASPPPGDPHARQHPTDMAVIRAATAAGLTEACCAARDIQVPFDAMRGYHATRTCGRLCIKGAPERLVPACTRAHGRELDDAARKELLERAQSLAERGLRVLMVAEGGPDTPPENPGGLTALGFIGMSDPLRPSAAAAVARCQEAGIRVLMLTGDHLGTARTIARQAGLFCDGFDDSVNAAELAGLSESELDQRLERIAVVARATPVDKVRCIESLRRRGHTVAMTGDGVNDAPAVRLADVGVAMGQSGTEAARQAADVVLGNDDFEHLAEALVEGRSFWGNMRHALGLLVGGNAGEMALYVGVTVAGFGAPLSPTQILLVSLITDALPSLAIAMRPPRRRHLSQLSREGLSSLDESLPRDTLRRGLATGLPALGAYLATRAIAGPVEARAVTFVTVICTQLAQTLDVGSSQGMLSPSVLAAVGGSAGTLGVAVGVPPVANVLGVIAPTAQGWATAGISSAAAVVLSRSIGIADGIWRGELRAAWDAELRRLRDMAGRLLPAPRESVPPLAALPAPV